MSAVADSPVRQALAAAESDAAMRRTTAARRLAFGLPVDREELVTLCSSAEATAALERESRRWADLRKAVAAVAGLPALEAAVQQSNAARIAKHAELTEKLRTAPDYTSAQREAKRALRLELHATQAPNPHMAKLLAARKAWAEVLVRIPAERLRAHVDREGAFERARQRVARATQALEQAESRTVVGRIKAKLAAVAAFFEELRPVPLAQSQAGAEFRDRLEARRRGEQRALAAQLAQEDNPQRHAQRVDEAREELDAARAELDAIAAEPELYEQIRQEFAAYELEASTTTAATPTPKETR